MMERGVCLIVFETKRVFGRWTRAQVRFAFLDASLFIEEHIGNATQDKLVSSPQAFSLIIQFEGIEFTKGIFL